MRISCSPNCDRRGSGEQGGGVGIEKSKYGTRIRTQNDLRTHPPPGAGVRGRRARTPDLCLLDSSLQTARLATDRDGNATDHTNKIERIRKISGARHGILSRTAGDRARAKCRDQDTVRNGGEASRYNCITRNEMKIAGGDSTTGQPERECAAVVLPTGKIIKKECSTRLQGTPLQAVYSDQGARESEGRTDHRRNTKGSGSMTGQPERGNADMPPPPGKHPCNVCDRPPPMWAVACPPVNQNSSDLCVCNSERTVDQTRNTKGSGSMSGQPERETADMPPPPANTRAKSVTDSNTHHTQSASTKIKKSATSVPAS